MKVKVCGLTREQDVRVACALGAWAVGFVLAEGSPRRVSVEQARRLRAAVAPGVLAVGVFEDALPTEIESAADACAFDAVQIHGQWPSFLESFGRPIWRGLGLGKATELALSPRISAVLVEPARTVADRRAGKKPTAAEQERAWSYARTLRRDGLLVLAAGGLTAANVGRAIELSGCDAVDVSSGVESAPGIKDEAKLKAFFAAAAAR